MKRITTSRNHKKRKRGTSRKDVSFVVDFVYLLLCYNGSAKDSCCFYC